MEDEYVGYVVDFITKYWLYILGIAVLFLVWKFNLEVGALAILATIVLGKIAWKVWVHYVQQDFISGIDFVLLEIVPPREVLRSPKAMELFFTNALYHFSEKGGKESYWQGAVWFWFSLEIASIDGQVHFYIRTPTRVRGLIETQMYAEYPQAQVKAVEDYTLGVDEISPGSAWNAWGTEFKLVKPEAFPIKTYVDFGLDKDPKEEFKVDPISPIIELFGSLQKGEQMWMQIVVTPSKKTWHTDGTWFGHHDWVAESRIQQEKLLAPYTQFKDPSKPHESEVLIRAPGFLENTIKIITTKTEKIGFDTGIRVMYVAKKEIFPPNTRTNNSRNIRLILRQYGRPDSNEFTRANSTQADYYSGIFMLSPEKTMILADRMLEEFRERSFFHHPLRHHLLDEHAPYMFWPFSYFIMAYKHPPTFVLNTEELATLWHFPGQILKVPTLERIESKEAAPPTNLPV